MKVYICDDDKCIAEELTLRCRFFMEERHMKHEILTMTSWPEELLTCREEEAPDILLLDIDMPGSNGIAIKDAMEQLEDGPFIIFVTSHREMVYEAFGRNVIGFLTKPVDAYFFRRLMEKACDFCRSRHLTVPLENGDVLHCREIEYVQAEHIYTRVVLKDRSISLRRSLTEWERLLPAGDFFRISDKYIIHFASLVKYEGDKVLLKTGDKLSVSRRRKADFKTAYLNYCTRQAKYK